LPAAPRQLIAGTAGGYIAQDVRYATLTRSPRHLSWSCRGPTWAQTPAGAAGWADVAAADEAAGRVVAAVVRGTDPPPGIRQVRTTVRARW